MRLAGGLVGWLDVLMALGGGDCLNHIPLPTPKKETTRLEPVEQQLAEGPHVHIPARQLLAALHPAHVPDRLERVRVALVLCV